MQNPTSSLKQGNIISVWTINMDIENTFAKGYCTYGAARFSPEFFPFIDPSTQQRTW
jgi:phenylalanyl-tRNA synthetase alpha subunit